MYWINCPRKTYLIIRIFIPGYINKGTIILLSQEEAHELKRTSSYLGFPLYHLTNGLLKERYRHLLTPEIKKRIAKAKFLNGDSHYSLEELTFLKEWFEKEGVERLKSFYLKQVLAGLPQKAIRFQGSPLDHLFKKLSRQ